MADVATPRPERIQAPDLSQVLTEAHYNQWVAFSPDYRHVLASAGTLKELAAKLSAEERARDPIFYRVPAKDRYYIPFVA